MPSRWTVTLTMSDNLPANSIQNQWCTDGPGGDDATIAAALAAFYDSLRTAILPAGVAQNGHIIKRYDLPGLTPNYPTYETTFNLTAAPTGDRQPSEVALCLSYQATRIPGQFQARKRGRVFIGPLKESTNLNGRPTTTATNALLDGLETLYDAVDAVTDAGVLAVWSTVDQVAYPIVQGWVDDAFDTQRSRGLQVSARTTRALV